LWEHTRFVPQASLNVVITDPAAARRHLTNGQRFVVVEGCSELDLLRAEVDLDPSAAP